ncbi:MAG: ParA family protein [Liquorilactobacillus satsumensis]|uniref:ParA family protein n=1 Tax=Liquorilactobacillus satsumensis TaxID=259059 RepID=UPI0039EB41ED
MKKIFIGNYKGGVGKTTSTLHIGLQLAKEHNKVLMIDLDPQCSLSDICIKADSNFADDLDNVPDMVTLNYVYDLETNNIENSYNLNLKFNNTQPLNFRDNLDYIPTKITYKKNFSLDQLAMGLKPDIRYFSILSRFISDIADKYKYDYVLIDCPPTSNVITQSAFLYSDYYLIPTIVDSISAKGIAHYVENINKLYDRYCVKGGESYFYKHYFGNRPKLIGVFYTLIRAQANYVSEKKYLEGQIPVSDNEQAYIFNAHTDNYVEITRQIARNTPEDTSAEKNSYPEITREMLLRIDSLSQ